MGFHPNKHKSAIPTEVIIDIEQGGNIIIPGMGVKISNKMGVFVIPLGGFVHFDIIDDDSREFATVNFGEKEPLWFCIKDFTRVFTL
jgi:hypothetical protein